jgi:hypothetical protein
LRAVPVVGLFHDNPLFSAGAYFLRTAALCDARSLLKRFPEDVRDIERREPGHLCEPAQMCFGWKRRQLKLTTLAASLYAPQLLRFVT